MSLRKQEITGGANMFTHIQDNILNPFAHVTTVSSRIAHMASYSLVQILNTFANCIAFKVGLV